MTAWVLVLWIGGMAGGPATIAGIDNEAECRALAVKFGNHYRGTAVVPRYECIKYEARKWP